MIKYLFILVLILFCTACQQKADSLEKALHFAGNNRTELEKVLAHYSSDPRDSLKYRAAVFLIRNMPYHYAFQNDKLSFFQKDMYSTAIRDSCSGEDAFRKLEKKYETLDQEKFKIVRDIDVMKADYLIRNIEQSFNAWQETLWGKRLTFDDFCEQILPYRLRNEPISEWREAYRKRFQPVLDSLLKDKGNPMEAICVLWDTIHSQKWVYWFNKPKGYSNLPAIDLLDKSLAGDCYELAYRGVYVMRALGIPGGCDFSVYNPYGLPKHVWNFVIDSSNCLWEFSFLSNKPRKPRKNYPMTGCVYRQCFGLQAESLPAASDWEKDLPPLLNDPFLKNVSEYYLPKNSISMRPEEKATESSILYLCTFDKSKWNPILWTKRGQGNFTFNHLENELLYMPAYYRKGKILPAGNPGYLNTGGTFVSIRPDTHHKQKILLKRKYPISKAWERNYNNRILNGKFQAADNRHFRNAITLHTITKKSDMQWKSISVDNKRQYKYVRYLSGDKGHCNMAEVVFLSDKGTTLKGKVIGHGHIYENKKKFGPEALFDDDPLTFYDTVEQNGTWSGLELDKPEAISTIRYLFRNDDNGIRCGDTYELFYWNGQQWTSLGRRIAEESILEYGNAPQKALFWLHNHTRGKEERPFVYHRGEQLFFSTDKIKQCEKE